MKRECVQKILSGFTVFCIALSFSICSFAAAFTGAYMTTEIDPVTGIPTTVIKDVNPSGQTFSGSNVIEMNAYNNAPTLTNNTFNGSTDINPDFTSITSSGNAYNGSVDINYDGLGGSLDSNGDRFQSTTVTAESSDISISNGTFNGTTNINAQSVSLGSISQMDTLNNLVKQIIDEIYIFRRQIGQLVYSSTSSKQETSPSGNTVTIQLNTMQLRRVDFANGHFTTTVYNLTGDNAYGNFRAVLQGTLTNNISSIGAIGQGLEYYINTFIGSGSYKIYSFSANNEYYSLTSSTQTATFREMIDNRLDIIIQLLHYYCTRFYEWYYPLDNVIPEYWRYYNTDTAQQENIGLAGLMYNISWYLGQMYVLQAGSDALDNMQDQVEAVTEVFEDAEESEQDIMDSISTGISSFNPDISELGAFAALGWCSNYLQLCFLRLGTYGTVILIGLLLGVCMQFIGYFRYKT